jgi:hypothetical protein
MQTGAILAYMFTGCTKISKWYPHKDQIALSKKKKSPFEQQPAKDAHNSYVEVKECYQQQILLLSLILALVCSAR